MSSVSSLTFLPLAAVPVAFLTVAACATTAETHVAPAAIGDNGAICAADQLSSFVGDPATQALGSQILAKSGARVLRWVAMGQMVTMDYRADRVTVKLDRENRVTALNCG